MIHLSSTAANEILRLRTKRNKADLLLRLGVQPKGCLGLSYVMGFDEAVRPGDQVYDCNGIRVVINAESLAYLDGLSLDYSEDLMGGGFRFRNPNSEQSCSCGTSFAIAS
ncbi:HesB/IscA family protein [Leptothermofonsia sp. ETS-13]|uniref:HesB/IscA family protein n=1 Tax=Leptothermofonsia sp. ETS-13 TaxID=3035696 RepID=UPI003BA2947B